MEHLYIVEVITRDVKHDNGKCTFHNEFKTNSYYTDFGQAKARALAAQKHGFTLYDDTMKTYTRTTKSGKTHVIREYTNVEIWVTKHKDCGGMLLYDSLLGYLDNYPQSAPRIVDNPEDHI